MNKAQIKFLEEQYDVLQCENTGEQKERARGNILIYTKGWLDAVSTKEETRAKFLRNIKVPRKSDLYMKPLSFTPRF